MVGKIISALTTMVIVSVMVVAPVFGTVNEQLCGMDYGEVNGIKLSNDEIVIKGEYVGEITICTIENADALESFENEYIIPSGCQIVWSDEEEGGIVILDENNEVLNYIEPSQAQDANGRAIESDYCIEGNRIILNVQLSKKHEFPIVIKSTSHPTITTTA